jgi:hypothetical protein
MINHDRVEGQQALMRDYFGESPVYSDKQFRRRFRMSRPLYQKIVSEVEQADPYFQSTYCRAGKPSFTALQKVTAAIRQLAYGSSADSLDEYLRMSESTALESLKRFCKSIISIYANEYMRKPNQDDVDRLLARSKERMFPGMLGSIDCMHWEWKNCPVALQGQYAGRSGSATMVLEAVASEDLWFWHAFFGLPGTLNDINVLDRSPLFNDVITGAAPTVSFTIGDNTYDQGYYLADGIYPSWATLVKTISNPQSPIDRV